MIPLSVVNPIPNYSTRNVWADMHTLLALDGTKSSKPSARLSPWMLIGRLCTSSATLA
jgi:hypothetical protein